MRGLIQRAFELAASGEYANVTQISEQLSKEGYVAVRGHLEGTSLRRQLSKACRNARVTELDVASGGPTDP
jgi:hypothetical protein